MGGRGIMWRGGLGRVIPAVSGQQPAKSLVRNIFSGAELTPFAVLSLESIGRVSQPVESGTRVRRLNVGQCWIAHISRRSKKFDG
jgi:hypothetical protein